MERAERQELVSESLSGRPRAEDAIAELKRDGISKLVVLPLYPQVRPPPFCAAAGLFHCSAPLLRAPRHAVAGLPWPLFAAGGHSLPGPQQAGGSLRASMFPPPSSFSSGACFWQHSQSPRSPELEVLEACRAVPRPVPLLCAALQFSVSTSGSSLRLLEALLKEDPKLRQVCVAGRPGGLFLSPLCGRLFQFCPACCGRLLLSGCNQDASRSMCECLSARERAGVGCLAQGPGRGGVRLEARLIAGSGVSSPCTLRWSPQSWGAFLVASTGVCSPLPASCAGFWFTRRPSMWSSPPGTSGQATWRQWQT